MTANQILITNGTVYDPINSINGEKKDIAIKDGKIVEDSKLDFRRVKVINAKDKIVFPGGIDLHSHIVSPFIYGLQFFPTIDNLQIFNLKQIGWEYAKMGWTTVMEPAIPPMMAKQAVVELNRIPIVDKGFYVLLGNNWFMMEYVREGDLDKLSAFISWILKNVGAYAVKVENPGGDELWRQYGNVKNMNDLVPFFDITPMEILEAVIKANESLCLPHSVHLHCNKTFQPGNAQTTLESIEIADKIETGNVERSQTLHLAHLQFNSYGGEDWGSMESRSEELSKRIDSTDRITADIGQVTFGKTFYVSPDGSLIRRISDLVDEKTVANLDFELENLGGSIPILHSSSNPISLLQWSIGLELALFTKDCWKLSLTTDSPNGGLFNSYPEIISWLMSKTAREAILEKTTGIENKSHIAALDREYDLFEIAVISRASPAKALGISKTKGHLGKGAIADISIYNIDTEKSNPDSIVEAFSNAKYTIKSGEIVVKNGEVVKEIGGRFIHNENETQMASQEGMLTDLKVGFKKFYSLNLENYTVSNSLFRKYDV